MSFALLPTGPELLLLLLPPALALFGASLVLRGRRNWPTQPAGRAGRWRIAAAVLRYDLWLDLHGVGRRRRHDLREELRSNLHEAAGRVGPAAALAALGSLRTMAAAAATRTGTGPHWSTGTQTASVVLLIGMLAELLAIISWVAAAEASGAARVQGGLPLFPGSLVIWERTPPDSLSIEVQPGWLVLAVAAAGFLIGSRIWLAGRKSRLSA